MQYDKLTIFELRERASGTASRSPDAIAQCVLGERYAQGEGVRKDEEEAARWFLRSAEQGNAEAQRYLAFAFLHGRGVKEDIAEGIRRLRLAAEAGDAPAQREMGYHFAVGSGVALDEEQAVRWFRLAADRGDAIAQYNLGYALASGSGVPKDPIESIHWYRLAAEQSRPEAQCALGEAFEHGLGVGVDYERSAHWNRLAAEQGNAEACGNLGWLYENGLGVPADRVQAQRWYEAGVERGSPVARQRLANLRARDPNVRVVPAQSIRGAESIVEFLEGAFAGLIGLGVVRDEIFRQASYIHIQRLRAKQGLSVPSFPSRHMVFIGNPGTGKTSVARIIAGLYQRLGISKTDKVVETDRAGLVAEYVGQTAIKTRKVVESALGGVLFIDEAYSLAKGGEQDFGRETIETLLKMMEDHREDLVVIVAGYVSEMEEFINSNPGLASRFNRYIRFPDYSPAELLQILVRFCDQASYVLSESTHAGLQLIFAREIRRQRQHFGNARYVRNLFEKIVEAQAQRVFAIPQASTADLKAILAVDVEKALGAALPADDDGASSYEAVLGRLDGLVGLERVKKQVRRLCDFARVQRARVHAGSRVPAGFSQHLVFTGNPGTGKTMVARIIADLYFALGITASNQLIEVDRAGLVAGYVGQSAIKTRRVLESAIGGVLFIDEAYALAQGTGENDFGKEVIDTLLKTMEDYRDRLVVIVAGYTDPMKVFIESNPGLRSRFNHYIEFDDYEPRELLAIFASLCRDSEYSLDPAAATFLLDQFQHHSFPIQV
jgi:TPR repeat protein/SpoVK/Ycf46/Vps4 family AAA+-type ATPase